MKITVSGYLNYRDFYFPATLFHQHVDWKFARLCVESSDFEKDLTPRAIKLGADILAIGGFSEIVFREGRVQVWSHLNGEFTESVINQIKDLIFKHYGPQAESVTAQTERIINLPFGYKLILPSK